MNTKLLAFAVISLSIGTSAFAASRLGGATQKGSLLVFPRVEALAPSNGASGFSDTYINITNDSSKPVILQCYWNTTEQHGKAGSVGLGGNAAPNNKAKAARAAIRNNHYMAFSLKLTKNQPASFWAGDLSDMENTVTLGFSNLSSTKNVPQFNNFQDGTQANAGELRCWAINNIGTKEIHHNHLMGKATIVTFAPDSAAAVPTAAGQAHEYNAWAFQAYYKGSNDIKHTSRPLPTPGQLDLDGKEYDLCPSALVGQFMPARKTIGNEKTRTQISIANCHDELTQDGDAHITNLNYTVYNANEVKFSGSHECMGAWYESDLGAAFPHFTYKTLKTDSAYFVVRPTASRLCNKGSQTAAMEKDIEASSIVGVQVNDIGGVYQTSSNLVGLGGGSDTLHPPAGKILWEPGYGDMGKK
ncbi:conserved exported hypothetical protein [Crenothrix polyspora]|uniref:Uncharacterized protein n=1 Tax=Crenothrix polyspora TaxID=360316 RepID=A0A1R4H4M4_9GAMM|nr:hypothetical protein [Crenothrix polyspora]SJM91213.1 conserved exported hypothetical protein [Crenothrix polyspora]